MLHDRVEAAIALWRELQTTVDDTTRHGFTPPGLLRLVSTARLSLENFLFATSTLHQRLQTYQSELPAHLLHCQTVYRTLYYKMYQALDKSATRHGRHTEPDGHALNDVPIDPASALNTISVAPVTLALPGDNEAILKYPPSQLATQRHVEARLPAIQAYFEQEQQTLLLRVTLPTPGDDDERVQTELHTHLQQIHAVLAPLCLQHPPVLALYGLCGRLQALVTELQQSLGAELTNMTTQRDNVLAMFMESVRLYDKLTRTAALQQSRQGGLGLGTIF